MKISPFLIEKAVSGCSGSAVQDNTKAAVGVLVETLNDQQGWRLLKMQKIRNVEVEVVPHTTLNTMNGVAMRRDLLNRTCLLYTSRCV